MAEVLLLESCAWFKIKDSEKTETNPLELPGQAKFLGYVNLK